MPGFHTYLPCSPYVSVGNAKQFNKILTNTILKKKELPQDKSDLHGITREVCYIKDSDGHYRTELSSGWDVKKMALDNAWSEIDENTEAAKKMVSDGKKSPIYYYMVLNLMDINILSGYTGISRFKVKKHMKPRGFNKIKPSDLDKYAKAFSIKVNDLNHFL